MSSLDSPESFRQLIKEIVVDELTFEELELLLWKLKLPKKLVEARAPLVAVLRSLGERRLIFEWSQNPAKLILVLEQIHREDLAKRVREWSDQQYLEPEECLIRQETTLQEDTPIILPTSRPIPKTRSMRRSQRGRALESVEEQSDEELMVIKSGEIKEDTRFLTDVDIHEENMQMRRAGFGRKTQGDDRILSTASSGYCSDRSSQRLSELSLSDTWQDRSVDGKQQVVESTVTASTLNPFSGGEAQGPRSHFDDFDDTDEFYRPRSKSLGNAKSARTQVNSKLHKGNATSSSSSLKSENPELTSWSSVSSQHSLSSDQSTTDQDSNGGSMRGSQESIKHNSLRRAQTTSSISINGQINIPLRKVKEDIAEGKNLPRTSDPFPSSKDVQYQLRFFSCNFAKKGCALYLDVAPKYLKKKIKRGAAGIKISEMEVTVDVSICRYPSQKRKVETAFKHVESRIIDLPEMQKQPSAICSFPNLINFEQLEHFDGTSDLVIEVYLKCL